MIFSQSNSFEFKKGIALYEKGDYKESLAVLLELEAKKSKSKELYYYIGQNYFNMGDYTNAEIYYKQAMAIDPDYFNPYIELSSIKINQRKTDEALAYVKKGLELNPDSGIIHLNYSLVLALLEDYEKSKSEVYKAAQLEPVLVMNYGMQFVLNYDKPETALYYLQIVEELYPKEPLVLYYSGHVYKLLKQNELAVEYFKFAYLNVDITYASFDEIWSTYFRILFDSKLYDQMIDIMFQKVDKDYPGAYFFLALIYYRQGKKEELKKAASRYFELHEIKIPEDLNKWAEEKCRGE